MSESMKNRTHNGFILAYNGDTFPASTSNQITKECFLFMGALANKRLYQVRRSNGSHTYTTYHNISFY